ncbi:MAG: SRPBCC domain-containing protein [Chloroflexota bacterium]
MEQTNEEQIVVSRTFDAPLELLWKAWTDPEEFKKWYGPKNFTTPVCEIDLKVGGKHLYGMRSPDGMEMFTTGTYLEIAPMERLVYSDSMSDAMGNERTAEVMEKMGMPAGKAPSMDVTVAFEHADGKTTVTISHAGSGEGGKQAGMGWEQALEKLEATLA